MNKRVLVREKWRELNNNKAHMEGLILKLMAHPETTPEHMAQAHTAYTDCCKRISEASYVVENFIRTGKVPTKPEGEKK